MNSKARDPIPDLRQAAREIAQEAAALAGKADAEHGWPSIIALISSGEDIVVLAKAMSVIAGRRERPVNEERYPRGL